MYNLKERIIHDKALGTKLNASNETSEGEHIWRFHGVQTIGDITLEEPCGM